MRAAMLPPMWPRPTKPTVAFALVVMSGAPFDRGDVVVVELEAAARAEDPFRPGRAGGSRRSSALVKTYVRLRTLLSARRRLARSGRNHTPLLSRCRAPQLEPALDGRTRLLVLLRTPVELPAAATDRPGADNRPAWSHDRSSRAACARVLSRR